MLGVGKAHCAQKLAGSRLAELAGTEGEPNALASRPIVGIQAINACSSGVRDPGALCRRAPPLPSLLGRPHCCFARSPSSSDSRRPDHPNRQQQPATQRRSHRRRRHCHGCSACHASPPVVGGAQLAGGRLAQYVLRCCMQVAVVVRCSGMLLPACRAALWSRASEAPSQLDWFRSPAAVQPSGSASDTFRH